MILSLLGLMTMANYGLSSKDVLEPLMAVIYTSPHQLLSKFSIGIEKASFHRIVSSYAISTCSSHTFFQAGRVLQQMLESGLMPWWRNFQCLQDFITLQMQDFPIAQNLLFHFVEFGIIFRSGELQVFGTCCHWQYKYYLFYLFLSPVNAKELVYFTLPHRVLMDSMWTPWIAIFFGFSRIRWHMDSTRTPHGPYKIKF